MITLGLSSHRIDLLDFVQEEMEGHDIILLEEPPHPDFDRMLRGQISVEEYVADLETAFPEYSKMMCIILRDLYKKGKVIEQVEPYLETLQKIHEMLAHGKSMDEILQFSQEREVYLSENKATKALLDYYSKSMAGIFETVVEAVKKFAKADSQRGRLRERMRAKAIVDKVWKERGNIYIEAGYLHFPMFTYLKKGLGNTIKIRVVFLQRGPIRKLTGKSIRQILSPGDILTLRYALGKRQDQALENLLAARSLIYIKLISQDEIPSTHSQFPHTEEEIKLNDLLKLLSYEDCKILFKQIRFLERKEAKTAVESYFT